MAKLIEACLPNHDDFTKVDMVVRGDDRPFYTVQLGDLRSAVLQETPAPRFMVGDRVRSTGIALIGGAGVVEALDEPRYWVRSGGVRQNREESQLEPEPVVCTPSGTRCDWQAATYGENNATVDVFCSQCGGRLRE